MKTKTFLIAFLLLPLIAFSQTVNIGDILCTDGSTVKPEQYASSGKIADGIVFFVDDNSREGWAVSLEFQATNTNWVTPGHYDEMYDIPLLENFEYSREAMYDLDGYNNTDIIRSAHGADWYPAAWCVDFDHGWYLPAAGQMRWMIAYLNEINASLAVVHGTMFVYDHPRWYWTSTERTEAHAVVLSQTGGVGNYPKWNYIGEYEIGVRAVKTFTVQPQSHHIGEVITTPSGQKGVVFYISPEDDSYWLVAMNDLTGTYKWGPETDIADLVNYNPNDQFVALHGVHCGYDATSSMREAMGASSPYAPSHIDFANGWHIPSVGQLSKLYAALPFIESTLTNNGGTTLSGDYYWASTESSSDNAWAINFGANLYTEGVLKDYNKTSQLRVRPIWSEPCVTPTPEPTLPDNIIETDCNRPLDGNTWSIQLLASHQVNDIASYAPIMAGDIDGNSVTDIVIAHYNGNNYRTNTLDVYSGIDLSLQYRFNIQDSIYVSNGPYAIMRYPKDDGTIQGAIFVHGYDKKIRSYAIDGTLLNVSNRATACDGMVSFADFNGDGYPEVYSGSDIFDAATLKWLCSGPESDNHGLSFRGSAVGVVNHHRCYFTMSLASNVLGDAKQELICGNTIYNVNIVSRTNSSLNSVTVNKTITPPSGYSPDGHVSLADLDLDGECEVLVTRCDTDDHTSSLSYFYAYKPSSGQILFQKSIQCLTTGYPLIGNIDNDPHPEIVFLEKQDYNPKIYCLRYTSQNGLETVWLYPHNDSSGQTGITLFDFNQDNIMEIVYRDSENLRIINGNSATPNNLFTQRMAAGTGTEYPIIADINGDGSAEIVATGLLDQSANLPGNGGLYVFGSPGNWSPARPVWNQYMYHVTNVNEDLTIPTYCFDKATVFTAPDGIIRRPYNNFLQQASYITQYGEPIGEMGEPQYVDIYDHLDDVYTWNETTYTAPGEYTQQFIDIHGCDSIVTLHLSDEPIELPDNILDSDCNDNTPIPFEGGHLLHQTPDNVHAYTTPLCGDIDGDGIIDIVVPHYTATDDNYKHWSNQLGIYRGDDLSLQSTISIPEEIYLQYCPYGLVKYPLDNGTLQGAIFVMCNDGKIRSYSKNGQLLNTSDFDPSCEGPLSFADFNNDGYAEVYVGNTIYDAATLRRLCSGPDFGNKGLSYRGSPNSPYPHRSLYAISYAYNVLGDAKLELICGNTIYNVNIISRTNPSLNSITVNKTITPPSGYPQDGQVALADLDLDGEVEVVVTKDLTDDCTVDNAYLYAYRPSNGEILFHYSLLCRSIGFPAICNIDSDPHPEIVFVDYHYDTYAEKMRCMRYTTGSGINTLWEIHHNDPSGMTTMAFFDFNLDEIPEIVYRDAYNLNIMNGSDGATLYSYPMRSGTAGEHPIIADINGDGHAEVIATGLLDDYYGNNGYGSLNVFGNSNWPDARPVWNQYVYNVTNVNEDLTVPSFCFNNATVFTASDGTIRRPYNNFLRQAYYITSEGEPYNPNGTLEVNISGAGCQAFAFNGMLYTETGHYEQLIESETSCDTLYNIEVTIGGTLTNEWTMQTCEPIVWNGVTYTEPGDYEQTFTVAGGCDSIVTLHLISGISPAAIPEIHGPQYVNVSTDLILGEYFYSIDSVTYATHYEWILEGMDWIMDTTSTNCTLIVTTPGVATLTVRAWNDCGYTEQETVIHAGFYNVDDNLTIPVNVYPNPANDKVFVETEGIVRVRLFNLLGQCHVEKGCNSGDKLEINLNDLAPAVYTIQIVTERGWAIRKLSVIR